MLKILHLYAIISTRRATRILHMGCMKFGKKLQLLENLYHCTGGKIKKRIWLEFNDYIIIIMIMTTMWATKIKILAYGDRRNNSFILFLPHFVYQFMHINVSIQVVRWLESINSTRISGYTISLIFVVVEGITTPSFNTPTSRPAYEHKYEDKI